MAGNKPGHGLLYDFTLNLIYFHFFIFFIFRNKEFLFSAVTGTHHILCTRCLLHYRSHWGASQQLLLMPWLSSPQQAAISLTLPPLTVANTSYSGESIAPFPFSQSQFKVFLNQKWHHHLCLWGFGFFPCLFLSFHPEDLNVICGLLQRKKLFYMCPPFTIYICKELSTPLPWNLLFKGKTFLSLYEKYSSDSCFFTEVVGFF